MVRFLAANWLLIGLVVAMIVMHRGGHGCGMRGRHGHDHDHAGKPRAELAERAERAER